MEQQKSGLADLCTIENLVRSDYFSDTYRAELTVGEEKKKWDIVHISLPFSPLKEKELRVRFGLADDADLTDYYKELGRCVLNYIATADALNDAEVSSVVTLASYAVDRKDGEAGSDIYMVMDPMESYSAEMWGRMDNAVALSDIISLGTRLCQITKGMSDVGVHFGVVDLDTTYVIYDADRALTTLGGFLYSSREDDDEHIKLPSIMPAHVHPILKEGEPASLATDIYSICSLLWTLLSGNHYTTPPDPETVPTYASEEIVELLRRGLDEDNVYRSTAEVLDIVRDINKGLHKVAKHLRTGEGQLEDVSVPMSEPNYDMTKAYKRDWKFSKPKFSEKPEDK